MKCPRCSLINEEGATHCDCGYNFSSGGLDRAHVRRRRRIQNWWPTKVLLLVGAFVVIEAIALVAIGCLAGCSF